MEKKQVLENILKAIQAHVSTRTANWAWKTNFLFEGLRDLFWDLLVHPIEPELPSSAVQNFTHKGVEQIFSVQERLINVFQSGCKFLIIPPRRSGDAAASGDALCRCLQAMSMAWSRSCFHWKIYNLVAFPSQGNVCGLRTSSKGFLTFLCYSLILTSLEKSFSV